MLLPTSAVLSSGLGIPGTTLKPRLEVLSTQLLQAASGRAKGSTRVGTAGGLGQAQAWRERAGSWICLEGSEFGIFVWEGSKALNLGPALISHPRVMWFCLAP